MKNRIFLLLLLVLSATVFSASVMAVSESPPDILKLLDWCQVCGC
ncbi:hypothetical protein CQK57_21495 [Salmonella enterica]|nr:PagK family vesicle-borne virulence factor [Salmonella enterica]EBG8070692.1 hypothetical protein [Salmonella enterica subsp. enterica serovar Elisabethville]EDU9551026.1 hypothetical protein [Salmonella enterica subsp. enterica]EEA5913252.1 hypothetical protein [Salmonella enterica subsp. enterica serovar Tafo]EAA8605651.1 hypothetical protein [Salmonella enterica]EBH3514553.1 hypothetical protein [Salmonella enterica subsp. enterica serovar Elisabethville]